MTTKFAYIALIFIWSTTPLAIKWSTEGVGYLFGIAGRMGLGLVVTYLIIVLVRGRMPWHRQALLTYLASGLGIYGAMGSVYWGAQYVPSGWVSVVFGLSPIITGIMAAVLLKEDALAPHKLAGIALGIAGLTVIFGHGAQLGEQFMYGVGAVFIGTVIHSISAVMVKRLNTSVSGFSITAGGLSFAVPLLALTWFLVDGRLPTSVPPRAAFSIIYLGVVASAIGFALYYFVLHRMTVSRVSLIALITPVIALLLGYALNNEPLNGEILLGTGGIVTGLLIYEYGGLRKAAKAAPPIP